MIKYSQAKIPLIILTVMCLVAVLSSIGAIVCQAVFKIIGFISPYTITLTSCASYYQTKYANSNLISKIDFVMVILSVLASICLLIGCILQLKFIYCRDNPLNNEQTLETLTKNKVYVGYFLINIALLSTIIYFGSFISMFLSFSKCIQRQTSITILTICSGVMLLSQITIWVLIIVLSSRINQNFTQIYLQRLNQLVEGKEIKQTSQKAEKRLRQGEQQENISPQRLAQIQMTNLNTNTQQRQILLDKNTKNQQDIYQNNQKNKNKGKKKNNTSSKNQFQKDYDKIDQKNNETGKKKKKNQGKIQKQEVYQIQNIKFDDDDLIADQLAKIKGQNKQQNKNQVKIGNKQLKVQQIVKNTDRNNNINTDRNNNINTDKNNNINTDNNNNINTDKNNNIKKDTAGPLTTRFHNETIEQQKQQQQYMDYIIKQNSPNVHQQTKQTKNTEQNMAKKKNEDKKIKPKEQYNNNLLNYIKQDEQYQNQIKKNTEMDKNARIYFVRKRQNQKSISKRKLYEEEEDFLQENNYSSVLAHGTTVQQSQNYQKGKISDLKRKLQISPNKNNSIERNNREQSIINFIRSKYVI